MCAPAHGSCIADDAHAGWRDLFAYYYYCYYYYFDYIVFIIPRFPCHAVGFGLPGVCPYHGTLPGSMPVAKHT